MEISCGFWFVLFSYFDMADGPAEDLYGIFINRIRRERPPEFLETVKGLVITISLSFFSEDINYLKNSPFGNYALLSWQVILPCGNVFRNCILFFWISVLPNGCHHRLK